MYFPLIFVSKSFNSNTSNYRTINYSEKIAILSVIYLPVTDKGNSNVVRKFLLLFWYKILWKQFKFTPRFFYTAAAFAISFSSLRPLFFFYLFIYLFFKWVNKMQICTKTRKTAGKMIRRNLHVKMGWYIGFVILDEY